MNDGRDYLFTLCGIATTYALYWYLLVYRRISKLLFDVCVLHKIIINNTLDKFIRNKKSNWFVGIQTHLHPLYSKFINIECEDWSFRKCGEFIWLWVTVGYVEFLQLVVNCLGMVNKFEICKGAGIRSIYCITINHCNIHCELMGLWLI